MSFLYRVSEYLRYRLRARSAHGIHSPFVYQFITTVLQDKRTFYAFQQIETLRKELCTNHTLLEMEDFGAGSLHTHARFRKISELAKNAGRSPHSGELLFRLIQFFQPRAILEMGSSLGLSTLYLALANFETPVYSIEGCKAVAEQAKKNFNSLQVKNIQLITGRFEDTLPELVNEHSFDFIFIDGNHRKGPTLDYFQKLLAVKGNNTVMVFDDIHWSKEMTAAWDEICAHQEVRLSMDLFQFGIVLFRSEFMVKQHFVLKWFRI
ncbi:MAG TPA: class I SAM-dependent methyltransferase [Chitinophagaceae bacterium]|nr:class I SAM-dependent methyltransferase [Chitinophagaceae bacterium]HNF72902.1 class I SAM-dependent methyltransferase [Chitinophagaceae bacterium]